MGKSKKNSQPNRAMRRSEEDLDFADQELADDIIIPESGMMQSGESTNANTATMQARKLQQDQQTTSSEKRGNQPDR